MKWEGQGRMVGLGRLDREARSRLLARLNLIDHRLWWRNQGVTPVGIALFLDGHSVGLVHPRCICCTQAQGRSNLLLGDGLVHVNAGDAEIVQGLIVLQKKRGC
jgi:hypothetical protein